MLRQQVQGGVTHQFPISAGALQRLCYFTSIANFKDFHFTIVLHDEDRAAALVSEMTGQLSCGLVLASSFVPRLRLYRAIARGVNSLLSRVLTSPPRGGRNA